jgi:RNA polymerase sigma-32 factor
MTIMNDVLPYIASNLPATGLDSYFHRIYQIPLLSAEEEMQYATNLNENNDLSSAKKLISSHLRVVVKVAKSYSGYGLALADLIQEGNIGLMKAVKRFDPKVGVRLVTYALHWIKSEIHNFILKNWRIVKVATTKAQRKCFFNLRKVKKSLTWFTHDEVKMIAEDLGVKEKDVLQMEQRLYAHDCAFDSPLQDHQEDFTSPANTLEDTQYDPAAIFCTNQTKTENLNQLNEAIESLDPRAQIIITERWLIDNKTTLQTLAKRFNVSAERIRQLEKSSMQKLAKFLKTV